MANGIEQRALVFSAMGDERRLRIIELLYHGEKCVCILTREMDMPQSSLSYHMKILCRSGLVRGRVFGKWTYYSLNDEMIETAMGYIKDIRKRKKVIPAD